MRTKNMNEHKSLAVLSVALTALSLLVAVAFLAAPARAEFGIAGFDQQITADSAGTSYTQAGGHPYEITTELQFNTHPYQLAGGYFGLPMPDADVKDVVTELPPGLIGNPQAIGQCTREQLIASNGGSVILSNPLRAPECPINSQVGTIQARSSFFYEVGERLGVYPLYNMVPPAGQPASFGFLFAGVPITIHGAVRNGGDFGVDVDSDDVPANLPVGGFTLTFWGVPADPSHDAQRCDYGVFGMEPSGCPGPTGDKTGPHADTESAKAFLTMPVSCTPPGVGLETNVKIDSWANPGTFVQRKLFNHVAPGYPLPSSEWGPQVGVTGCDAVPFKPSIAVEPTNHQADTPSGLNINISLPQEGLLNPAGITTADVKKAVVTLPAGESVSPSAADGLQGCSLAQIGLENGLPPSCPEASKLGTVEVDTPLLPEPLKGAIFLGKQGENPFGSLIALYIVAEGYGVILKLPGHVDLDPQTGQITTTFDNDPQLPFDHLKLNFKAGPRSPLVNPHTCGTYETQAQFTPWSSTPPVEVASSFEITSGPNGSPCPAVPQVFGPAFVAGTVNNQAGAFSPLSVSFTRNDGEQQLGGVTVKTPPGLLGMLTGVPLCEEPAASQGTCPAASQIGTTSVRAGAGANPFFVNGGRIYLTAGYKGQPFGLSIVVPAVAGPFNLGTVVVRASIAIDPVTTALTVTTDPLPTILQGIPLDLRTVNVQIDRPGFIFNPTNCNPMSLSGTLTGGLGGSEAVASSFQVTNCARLGFAPKFTVTTPGRTSRARGAGLTAKIVYPKGAQANIAKVKVDLPKQLPSRLTTLQKACPDAVFNANPARCPRASLVGSATALTPVLPVPLAGPAYFVSHGGEAFPDLIVVLQGYGVTFNLIGATFISKAGITSSTFKSVPDVPISSFVLTLPQGPNSALAANSNLCKSKLTMPTTFVAQNGDEIHQSTKIGVTGCPKVKKVAKRRKAQPRGRSKKHRS